MNDMTTDKPLHVSTDGNAGPYIMVPVKQRDDVCGLLDANEISYWVDEFAISLDGKPAMIVINLSRDVDASRVQRILDNVS